ncbi:mobilization protein, partial [Streptomyces sp. TRM68367]|nr:mobilization protein [Streptomyces sp. TRM68367]
LPKIKARLESSQPEEHPTARRNHPSTPWHEAADALDSLHTDLADDTHAQAHITALGELIEATAQKAPAHLHAELQAASKTFARAQRSQVRAEDRAAHALRSAARDIVHTATGPDGSALAALVAALVWAAIVARRWHEAKHHAHQGDAARQAVQHLQTAADRALAPTLAELTARPPRDQVRRILASDVRAAVPDHAEQILTDPAWPALATVLADAEARGHQPHQLLKEAAAQRELIIARQPARVLITRIQHTGRNPAPHRRAEAARLQSTMAGSISTQRSSSVQPATAAPTEQQRRQRR